MMMATTSFLKGGSKLRLIELLKLFPRVNRIVR